jgi:hypothetical protein
VALLPNKILLVEGFIIRILLEKTKRIGYVWLGKRPLLLGEALSRGPRGSCVGPQACLQAEMINFASPYT